MGSLQRVTAEELQKMLGLLCFLFDTVRVVDWKEEERPCRVKGEEQIRSHPLLLETPRGEREVVLELTRRPTEAPNAELDRHVWEKVYRDDLTHTYNRRYMNEFRFWKGAAPSRLGLVLLDLRKFKQINDTLGHAAGDHILVRVAETLMAHQRTEDAVIRFGGDEFVLLFPGIEEQRLRERVEELRAAVEKIAKADFGYAWTDAFRAEQHALLHMLNQADQRMYEEKRKDTEADRNDR